MQTIIAWKPDDVWPSNDGVERLAAIVVCMYIYAHYK
jgi:hypothetical protein